MDEAIAGQGAVIDAIGGQTVFQGHDIAHRITRADVAQCCVDRLTNDDISAVR